MTEQPPEYQFDWGAFWAAVGTFIATALGALGMFIPRLRKSSVETGAKATETRIKADRAALKNEQDKLDFAIRSRERMYQDAYDKMMQLADREQAAQIALAKATTLLEELKKDLAERDQALKELKEAMRAALEAKDREVAELRRELEARRALITRYERAHGSDPDKKRPQPGGNGPA